MNRLNTNVSTTPLAADLLAVSWSPLPMLRAMDAETPIPNPIPIPVSALKIG